jgi:Thaumatin family
MVFTPTRRARLAAGIAAAVPAIALVAGCAAGAPTAAAPAAHVQAAPARAHAARPAHRAPRLQLRASAGPVAAAASAMPAASPSPAPAASAPAAPAASPAAATATANGPRRVTFVNKVQQTIWVAAAPDPNHPLARTGWVLLPGHHVTITVPDHWNGRFWGRTGCVFRNGHGHCQTGDCGGEFQCTGYGSIPATLAEYNLDAWDNLDFYDVSMVDGSNLPMYIYPTSGKAPHRVGPEGCVKAGCTHLVSCPAALKIFAGKKYVACESPCAKLGGDQYCCRGKWAPRAMCQPSKWPVDYARVFKRAEPYAYSYVDDDATSVYVCTGRCNYHIVFGVTPPRK